MAKDRDIDERIERVEEIIQQLESGEVDSGTAEQLFEEGQRKLDEVREILDHGDAEIVELPE
ncbi:exodeoxyribonuclease VII small subunit [Halobacteriales archaeon QS_1_68_17]|nr:MAG: exodeoxyribonuclease VII small subunit [Halobacteriales archaeon QS_1_68_17]